MRALTADPQAPSGLRFADAPEPMPRPDQTLVRVLATGINRGERTRLATAPAGHVFGWDVVGVVERNAALGPRFEVGQIVTGLAASGGGWAERVAIRSSDVAGLPIGMPPALAAALPVAGLTALRGVRLAPRLLGSKVLVIGTGSVATFAVQFAGRAGAAVSVAGRNIEQLAKLANFGAVTVPIEEAAAGYDLVVDTIGGALTPLALRSARAFGLVVVIGNVGDPAVGVNSTQLLASGASLQGYRLVVDAENDPLGHDLYQLLGWIETGAIAPPAYREIDWTDEAAVGTAVDQGFGSVRAILRIAQS